LLTSHKELHLSNPLTHADRFALGLAARKQLARSAHAEFSARTCQHDPLDLLRQSERGRVPSLIKLKHERMAASAFGFFRGAVPVMAADLACHPNTGIVTQLCGDAHVLNLGAFAAPNGNLAFDINDFDEAIHGPFEFDVKRLATSIILAGREAGIKRSIRRDAVLRFTARYRESMRLFAAMPVIELARYQIHRLSQIDPMPEILAQAERSTPQKSLKSLTEAIPTSAPKKKKVTVVSEAGNPLDQLACTSVRRRSTQASVDLGQRQGSRPRRFRPLCADAATRASPLPRTIRCPGRLLQSRRHRLGRPARLLHLLRRPH
jgi:hypothetical protein